MSAELAAALNSDLGGNVKQNVAVSDRDNKVS